MKNIRLDIEYPKRIFSIPNDVSAEERKELENIKPEKVSWNVITAAIQIAYREKLMPIAEMKMWSKIQDKITDDNGKPLAGDKELSDEQFDFLLKTLSQTNMPPGLSTAVITLVDYLEKVKLEKSA